MICMLIIVNVCREYMYRGRVESQEVDTLKGVFLAANMLQMTDLELLTVHKLHKLCNLANCLDMSVLLEYFSTCKVKVPVCRYFFVTSYCDLAAHPAIYRKVKRVLAELLAEHWGEMICQTNSNTCRCMSRNGLSLPTRGLKNIFLSPVPATRSCSKTASCPQRRSSTTDPPPASTGCSR